MTLATCPNCGAPLSGGSWTCRYCHATVDPSHAGLPSLGEFTAQVQGSQGSLAEALPQLVAGLETALPGAVKVERDGGLLHRTPRIRSVSVSVGDHRFLLRRNGDQVVTTVEHEVRGVVLRHDTMPPGEWLVVLAESLRELARQARTIEPALARLLGTDT